jgi:hypothetical protein
MLFGRVKDLTYVVQAFNVVQVHEELRGVTEKGNLIGCRGL